MGNDIPKVALDDFPFSGGALKPSANEVRIDKHGELNRVMPAMEM